MTVAGRGTGRPHADGALVALLVLAVTLLLAPTFFIGTASAVAFAFVLTLVAAIAAHLLARGPVETVVTLALGLPLVATAWAHVLLDEEVVTRTWLVLGGLFFGWTSVLLLRDVLRAGPVDRRRLAGALGAYLMLGFTGGFVHALVEDVVPGSYAGLAAAREVDARNRAPVDAEDDVVRRTANISDCMYFSFVTLTTTGYGDITPATRLARALAILQSVAGLVFLGVVVARVVGRLEAGGAART